MKSKLCVFSVLVACLFVAASTSLVAKASMPPAVSDVLVQVDPSVMDPPSQQEQCWEALRQALYWCDRANDSLIGACQISYGDGHHPTELQNCLATAAASHASCVADANDLYFECVSESKIDHPVAASVDDPWAVVLKTVTTFNPENKFHLN